MIEITYLVGFFKSQMLVAANEKTVLFRTPQAACLLIQGPDRIEPGLTSHDGRWYIRRMNAPLKVIEIGDEAGLILSKELLAHLGVDVGDRLSVARTSRGLELSRLYDDDPDKNNHARQMAVAHEIMQENREILGRLAKS